MSQQFIIFHDPEYDSNNQAYGYYITGVLPINKFIETCLFDTNAPYSNQGFYVATTENNKVCYECIIQKDPQILNILNFIVTGNDYTAKIKKFELGMDELRRITPVADPSARRCPICKQKKAYKQSFDGYYGFKCNECHIGYIGPGQFYYNGKIYNPIQAGKIFKMKAFK